MRRALRFTVLGLFALLAALDAASAQPASPPAVRQLLESDAALAPYRSQSALLLGPFATLEAHGLPSSLLTGMLLEGASKRVAAPLLAEALGDEAKRLVAAQAMLAARAAGAAPATNEQLKRVSLALQGGVPAEVIEWIVRSASTTERGLVLCDSLIALLRVGSLGEPELLGLSRSVLGSRLTPTSYRSLPSLFVRGRLRGLTMEDTNALVTRLLDRGYGLIQIEAEIQRQARTP